MKKLGYVVFLIGGTLSAQSKPFQLFPPRPAQDSITRQVLDAAKLPVKPRSASVPQVANCAIPLLKVPIPDAARFAIRRATPSPSVDPKIVMNPALPACTATSQR